MTKSTATNNPSTTTTTTTTLKTTTETKTPTIPETTTTTTTTMIPEATTETTTPIILEAATETTTTPILDTTTTIRMVTASTTKLGQTTKMTPKHASHAISTAGTPIIILNSTGISQRPKPKLPLIVGSILGGLAVLALITSIIIYILIKQGHINIFNEPRIRIKNVDRPRTIDSSSIINRGSPSRR